MQKMPAIAACLVWVATSDTTAATDTAISIDFVLNARVDAEAFQARRSLDHPAGPIVIDKRLDDGNPHAPALKVDVWGGSEAVHAVLVEHFTLRDGDRHIPMAAIKRNQTMTPDVPVYVAHPHELLGAGKTLVFELVGQATTPPRAGNYVGQFSMVFEPVIPD